MNDTITPEEEIRAAEQQARGLATAAKLLVIESDEDYRAASVGFSSIKQMRKDLEAKRVSITGPLNQSLKIINEGFKRADAEYEAAQQPYERGMLAFQKKQEDARREAERIAREEETRLREEARRRADEEERQMREALDAADAARAEASKTDDPVAAMLAEDEAARRELEAADARARAENEIRASARIEVVADAPLAVTGAGSRVLRPWKHRIVDASKVPDQFKVIDEKALAAYAKAMKDKAAVAGVEFFQDMKIGGA